MKKKFKFLIFLFTLFIFTSLNTNSSEIEFENPLMNDERFACDDFFNKLKESDDNMTRNFFSYNDWDDFGFDAKFINNPQTGERFAEISKEGNLFIGQIYNDETASKIKSGDEILFINDRKIKSTEEFYGIITDENVDKIKISLLDQKLKKYEAILNKSRNEYRIMKYAIKSFDITDVDIKKSTYDLSITHDFAYFYSREFFNSDEDKPHPILKIALENLIFYNQSSKKHSYNICKIDEQVFKDMIILDPSDGTKIENLVKSDSDLEVIRSRVIPYHKLLNNNNNYVKITKEKFNVLKIKNDFNLRSFPFDKQTLKFQINDIGYGIEARIFESSSYTYRAFDKFLKKDDIPGWEKKSFLINNNPYTPVTQYSGTFNDSHLVEIELERKHGYYIFKVILPIILILMVCWSVVWVDPKELEARLTITIVCLLSLIAYNFVIDSELPKLEYLTVLDWIVLISYVYATVPNFLSVISFRLQKTNLNLSNKIEQIAKRYGLSSYVLSIFMIVLLNANLNTENSSTLISWMAGKI
ncbi:hypothetical protein OA950_02150 [Candidatus Pelagibacter sp.]|nr:hypothetical protein [Candidatus Pelagibacter sp.]